MTRTRMEAALSAGLEDSVWEPLRFRTAVNWAAPGPAAVRRLLLHGEAEFAREDGLARQPVALAAFTDLFVQTARQSATASIGLTEIAAAAGCSIRSLQGAFRRFRDTTPYQTLRQMRLELAAAELRRGDDTVATVARRYGFSNVSRFAALYTQRYGRHPRW